MAEGFISEEDVEKVRAATDIVSLFSEIVPVQQRGSNYWCVCPFHNDKNPSLKIDPVRQTFHCFGCQASGDVFSFVKLTDGVDFGDAVRKLADRAHIEIRSTSGKPHVSSDYKSRLKAVCASTAIFYHIQLMRLRTPEADAARAYLAKRSLGGSVPNTWNLGYAPGNDSLVHHLTSLGFQGKEMLDADVATRSDDGRIHDRFYRRAIFPIQDLTGDTIAFGGRVIGTGEPKYLNSKETPIFKKSHVLFGFNRARDTIAATGTAIVMEGYTDVILSHEAGITNAVATLGTALTMDHIRQLAKFAKRRIVYLFDGDAAGQKAIARALQFIDSTMTPEAGRLQVQLCAVTLPDDLDPADYVTTYGADAFREQIDKAKPLLQFGIERVLSQHDLSTAEGRSAAFTSALAILAPIKDSIIAKDYASQLASQLRIREDVALRELRRLEPRAVVQSQTNPDDEPIAISAELPDYRDSRLRFEREFLSMCACNPQQAIAFREVLPSISWQAKLHAVLAQGMAEVLRDNPQVSCAELISGMNRISAAASAVLLGGEMADTADVSQTLQWLYEELRLGDVEDAIARDRAELSRLQASGDDKSDRVNTLFSQIASAQKELITLRKAHSQLYRL